jgi:hypothetical protein
LGRLAISAETLLHAHQLMSLGETVLTIDGHELKHYDFSGKLAQREIFSRVCVGQRGGLPSRVGYLQGSGR